MYKKVFVFLIIMFLSSINVRAEANRNIEIFDIKQEKVVKVLQSKRKIQKLAASYIQGISGVYGKFNPIPDKGHAIRIPLEPSIKIHQPLLSAVVDEIIIMFPEDEKPFLLLFENENKLMCFTFEGDTNSLLKYLDYKLNISQEKALATKYYHLRSTITTVIKRF